MSSRLVAPLCSGSLFSARPGLRIVEHNAPNRFYYFNEFTRQHLIDCPQLAELVALDATQFLAVFGGLPGLIRGVNWGSGQRVWSENLKHTTTVCSSRVVGGGIKFNHGSNEFKEERENCWEFAVKRLRIQVLTQIIKEDAQTFPIVILREETKCPVCDDDLSGCRGVVSCASNHQVCLSCFNLTVRTGGVKKCPICNVPSYSKSEIEKVALMNGREVKKDPYFLLTVSSRASSFKDFTYNEGLFLHAIKFWCCRNYGDVDKFRTLVMSAFFNFYITHKDAFGSYEFSLLNQIAGNYRSLNPFTDELPEAFQAFVEALYEPEKFKAIYQDVAYTDLRLLTDDTDLFRDLQAIDGNIDRMSQFPNEKKEVLKREVYFRNMIRQNNKDTIKFLIKNTLQHMVNNSSVHGNLYKHVNVFV